MVAFSQPPPADRTTGGRCPATSPAEGTARPVPTNYSRLSIPYGKGVANLHRLCTNLGLCFHRFHSIQEGAFFPFSCIVHTGDFSLLCLDLQASLRSPLSLKRLKRRCRYTSGRSSCMSMNTSNASSQCALSRAKGTGNHRVPGQWTKPLILVALSLLWL